MLQVLLGEELAICDHGLLAHPSLLAEVNAGTLQGLGCLNSVHASLLAVVRHPLDNGLR